MKKVKKLSKKEQRNLIGGIYGGAIFRRNGKSCTDPIDTITLGTGSYFPVYSGGRLSNYQSIKGQTNL